MRVAKQKKLSPRVQAETSHYFADAVARNSIWIMNLWESSFSVMFLKPENLQE